MDFSNLGITELHVHFRFICNEAPVSNDDFLLFVSVGTKDIYMRFSERGITEFRVLFTCNKESASSINTISINSISIYSDSLLSMTALSLINIGAFFSLN